ncbi:porin [Duganella sp. CF517]|uniref:porin n=1 Tax=Duganella sp. CF517 TaxID=1881038 RepID=UPI0008B9D3FD|nr:porin [Duganella sp. CF517]SEO09048.1 porin [Duganella sp. CF517]
MKKQLMGAAVLAALATGHVHAGALDSGDLTISGFGTVGVAKSNTDDVRFVRYNQAEGVGDGVRLGLDTNLGLQASYKINDWLSTTGQVLTRKGPRAGFTTDLTWAFVKARINDEFSVRAGRLALPTFLISEYQNVGYANTMMRPPIEMYGQVPIESHDGVDLIYQRAFGELNLSVQPYLGVSRGKLYAANQLSTYRAPSRGIAVSGEYGPFVVRGAHMAVELHNDAAGFSAIAAGLRAAGYPQTASDFILHGQRITFTSIGATMDWNNIVLQTEYAQRRPKDPSIVAGSNSWYAMAGYRVGKLLPYYTHAAYHTTGTTLSMPAGLSRATPLGATVAGILGPVEQSSDQVGVRWDFSKGMALKLQADRVKPKAKSGSLIGGPAVYTKSVTVVGATVDFVF